jgi:hypothetical protein
MNESEIPIVSSETNSPAAGSRVRRRAPVGRKAAAPRPKATRRPPATPKRKAVPRSRQAPRANDLRGLLRALASKASGARGRLAAASGEGARATRRTWQKVSGASRKTIDRLAAEWKQMDTAKKAQVLAALLAALAAASAPMVRKGLKKR